MNIPQVAQPGTEGTKISHPWAEAPAPGEVREVAPGILWARLPLPMALDHVNIYVLDEGDRWTLVDTGLGWAKGRAVMKALVDGPLSGKPVGRVIVTHHHPDHIGLAGDFAREGAEILTSRVAWLTARMLVLDRQDEATPEQILFRQRAGVSGADLDSYRAERPFNFADCVAPIPLGYTALGEGDELDIGGRHWTVRLGEGHAPAHVTLWSDDGLMIAGDQVLPGISPNIGVYPTEPEADPLAGWLATCHRLKAHAGDDILVLPGHRRPFRGLGFRLDQLVENHKSALARIHDALATEALNACEIFPTLYRREIGAGEFGLALVEAVAHLNHLFHNGRVGRRLDNQGAWRYSATSRQ